MTAYQVTGSLWSEALRAVQAGPIYFIGEAKAQYDMDQAAYLKAKTQYMIKI